MFKSFFGVTIESEKSFKNGEWLDFLNDEACCVWADQSLPVSKQKPVIILNSQFAAMLTDDEIVGVLHHEIGHLLAGHCAERRSVNSLQSEIEADTYAISQGTLAETMLSTLYKTAWWYACKKMPQASADEKSAKAISLLKNDSERAGRLHALEALCVSR